jgi:hypothetical protein
VDDLDPIRAALLRDRMTSFLMTNENAEVFAWYGQAVAIAQALEAVLINYLSILRPRTRRSRDDPSHIPAVLTKADMGRLQRDMEKYDEFRNAHANLVPLNDLRVQLVHYWFVNPERQEKLGSADGRAQLVAELRSATDQLGPAAAAVGSITLLEAFAHPNNGDRPNADDK